MMTRFDELKHMIRVETDDCILWPYSKGSHGYGELQVGDGKRDLAHRAALTLAEGPPPTPDHHACHLPVVCHSPPCINPRHLAWQTRRENMRDKKLDGTENIGGKNGQSTLTEEQVRAIYADPRVQRVIAAEYGINRQQVSRIKLHDRWGHLWSTPPPHRKPRRVFTEMEVRAIESDPRVQTVIARDYGVSESAISAIKNHKTWRHLWRPKDLAATAAGNQTTTATTSKGQITWDF